MSQTHISKTLSIYWPLTLFFKKKYPLYWIFVGTLFFVVSEIVLDTYHQPSFVWTELFFSYFIIAGLPIITLFSADVFDTIPQRFHSTFKIDDSSQWIFQQGRHIFDRRYAPMWIAAVSNNVLCTLTLLAIGTVFKFEFANVFMLIVLQPVFFFCGQACFAMVMTGVFVYRLVRLPLSVPFLEKTHRLITTLSRHTYFLAICGLVEYLGLFVAIRFGPYEDSVWMLPWLIGLAFTPIVVFTWGTYQLHVLQREVKFIHLESINGEVGKVFNELKSSSSLENIERLSKIIDVQKRIEDTREWPIALSAVVTLLLALAAALAQVLASISTMLKAPTP